MAGQSPTGDPHPPARPAPPDPSTATDIPGFVSRLNELRVWAGRPGYKKTLQAMADRTLGPGQLAGTTVWRVLESRQDLALMREPHRFVRDLVTVFGADPAPWLDVLARLLRPRTGRRAPTPVGPGASPHRRSWLTRKVTATWWPARWSPRR
ncbi:hypothetical protein [Actinophytocola sediminis]